MCLLLVCSYVLFDVCIVSESFVLPSCVFLLSFCVVLLLCSVVFGLFLNHIYIYVRVCCCSFVRLCCCVLLCSREFCFVVF